MICIFFEEKDAGDGCKIGVCRLEEDFPGFNAGVDCPMGFRCPLWR